MDANNIIGSTLSDELFRREMTPADLAMYVGIARCTIEAVCDGRSIDTSIVETISRGLGVNLFLRISELIDEKIKTK